MVRFKRRWRAYNSDEKARFDLVTEKWLVKKDIADACPDPERDKASKPATT
jgi:hypothetical protein